MSTHTNAAAIGRHKRWAVTPRTRRARSRSSCASILRVFGTTSVTSCSSSITEADLSALTTASAIASAGCERTTRLAAGCHFQDTPPACSKSGQASAIGKRAEPSAVTLALGGHLRPVPRMLGAPPRSTLGFSPNSSPSTIAGGIGLGFPGTTTSHDPLAPITATSAVISLMAAPETDPLTFSASCRLHKTPSIAQSRTCTASQRRCLLTGTGTMKLTVYSPASHLHMRLGSASPSVFLGAG